MSRSLHVGTLVLACAVVAPACLLNAGPIDGQGGSGGTSSTTTATTTSTTGGSTSGGSGGSGGSAGGSGGTGGSADDCGDGNTTGSEKCDDGNTDPDDGCSAQCQVETGWLCDSGAPTVCKPDCGDGMTVGPEVCDDGNEIDTDGCKADCLGANPGWDCDPAGGACTSICGDGYAVGGEECDDYNVSAHDGCDADCKLEKTCGNGIVDPTEQCDGGPIDIVPGCAQCQIADGATCSKGLVITPDPDGLDDVTGVRVTTFQGNSDSGILPKVDLVAPPQQCKGGGYENVVLHTYTTGKLPSIVTVKTLEELPDGNATFNKTIVWVFRDCPGKREIEGCDADSGTGGDWSNLTTGYIPAQTTLYIAIAGDGMPDKGVYLFEITEQPVKLFFHENFGQETMAGTYPVPASLTYAPVADGGWATCVSTGGGCNFYEVDSHSGGAKGFATAGTAAPTEATLGTPNLDLAILSKAYGQVQYDFNKTGGGSSFAKFTAFDGMTPGDELTVNTAEEGRRAKLDLVPSANARMDILFNDGAAVNSSLGVDDIYIYGH